MLIEVNKSPCFSLIFKFDPFSSTKLLPSKVENVFPKYDAILPDGTYLTRADVKRIN